jgi:mannan endo-1,4-beta-mannosidase
LPVSEQFVEKRLGVLRFGPGKTAITLRGGWGPVDIDGISLRPVPEPEQQAFDFKLTNPSASAEAVRLMDFFRDIRGKKLITGQHVNSREMPEIGRIGQVTGRYPFLLGLDFLGCSRRTDTVDLSEHGRAEIEGTKDCADQAIRWAERGGLVTFTWHWFAPTGGRDKSFYTKNSDFDLEKTLQERGPAYDALIGDMDEVAGHLTKLRDRKIPVLWRPLHEADGRWFWWGAKGPESYKKLYRLMYDRYTNRLGLDNLIWVWNAPSEGWYPGDDVVDINSVDVYAGPGNHGPHKFIYDEVRRLCTKKPLTLGENGPVPDPGTAFRSGADWLWYMTWWGHGLDPAMTDDETLRRIFGDSASISLPAD